MKLLNVILLSMTPSAYSFSSFTSRRFLSNIYVSGSTTRVLGTNRHNRASISSSALSLYHQTQHTPIHITSFLSLGRRRHGRNFDVPTSANRQLIFETFAASDSEDAEYSKSVDDTFNIPELRKETERLILRCHKKVAKANARYNTAVQTMEDLLTREDATDEELNACPNVDALKLELDELKERMKDLRIVEERLVPGSSGENGESIPKKGSIALPADLAQLVTKLEINDFPPVRKPSVKKKKKGDSGGNGPRLPYRRYYSKNNIEIRVGKKAEDNDELSCNPAYRDGPDWWMHASGCPGSHVVIRCHDQNLDKEVVMDAASLAARQSKCGGANIKVRLRILFHFVLDLYFSTNDFVYIKSLFFGKVSLTRCRDVKKPAGAKPGLVQLTGDVKTVTVNMKEAEQRLARLDETVLIN